MLNSRRGVGRVWPDNTYNDISLTYMESTSQQSRHDMVLVGKAAPSIGRRIAIFRSGIGCRILSRHIDRILDIGYRISESDILRQMIKKPLDGNAEWKQKTD